MHIEHMLEKRRVCNRKHPGAPCHIRTIDFNSIPFCSTLPFAVSGCHSLEWGVDVRGHPIPPPTSNSSDLRFNILPYIPLHCRFPSYSCYNTTPTPLPSATLMLSLFTLPLFLHSYSPSSLPPSMDNPQLIWLVHSSDVYLISIFLLWQTYKPCLHFPHITPL